MYEKIAPETHGFVTNVYKLTDNEFGDHIPVLAANGLANHTDPAVLLVWAAETRQFGPEDGLNQIWYAFLNATGDLPWYGPDNVVTTWSNATPPHSFSEPQPMDTFAAPVSLSQRPVVALYRDPAVVTAIVSDPVYKTTSAYSPPTQWLVD